MAAYASAGSVRRVRSTTLMVSTKSRQSMVPRKRRLPMLLLMETWSAACCWLPDRTSCSMLRPDTASCCSIQVSGMARAGPCPCRRRVSSDTNGVVIGGSERAMSAMHQNQVLRILCGPSPVSLCAHADGHITVRSAGGDAHRHAAQILDQRQAQHDGDGPQLTQQERRDRLVGRDEPAETVRVHPPIAVGDGLEGDVVHARQPGGGAVGQARQIPAVPLGQVAPGRADLFFHEVEVVEQPLPGGRHAVARRKRFRQLLAGLDQDALVRGQPRQQLVRGVFGGRGGAWTRGARRAAPSERR